MQNNVRHAYLIMAHDRFDQLVTLLHLLDDCRNDIFIHIDRKSHPDFSLLEEAVHMSKIFFVDRYRVRWGGPEQVWAELALLRKAIEHSHYAYYHLLTGQDLPLKTQDVIHDFFYKNQGKEFISFVSCPSREDEERIRLWHPIIGRRGKDCSFLDNLKAAIHHFLCCIQRVVRVNRIPDKIQIGKGSVYFSITDGLARDIVSHEKQIRSMCRMTMTADEVFLQTFVLNSSWRTHLFEADQFLYKETKTARSMRLIDWDRGDPYVWRISDSEELRTTHMLFARKFDIRIDESVVRFVENILK